MKKLFGYFFKGLLLVLPLFVLIIIIRAAFSFLFPLGIQDVEGVVLGLVLIVSITLIGFVASKGIGAYLRRRASKTLARLPLLGRLVSSGQKAVMLLRFSQEIFDRPVIVRRENGRELAFGFITKASLPEFGLPDHASVYLPSPFSFLGNVAIIRGTDLEPLAGDQGEIVNFILSGGLAGRVE